MLEEPDIPYEMHILFEDKRIIVVDKPHFLPTTPRGMWFRSTALIRLREWYADPNIIPAHRLDRSTAGVVVFVRDPTARGAYQMLFQRREVHKMYECIAPAAVLSKARVGVNRHLKVPATFPLQRISRIEKDRGTIQAHEVSGEANSRTLISVSDDQRAVAASNRLCHAGMRGTPAQHLHRVYELHPLSGKTHQLRVHMNAIGLPIFGDDLYPKLNMRAADDFSQALQLVARSLEFRDPFSGELRRFTSQVPLHMPDPL